MKHPRYEVRSITGYTEGVTSGDGSIGTVYWVADTWYCYREQTLLINRHGGGKNKPCWRPSGKTTVIKGVAERNCERLNREHDEWLAA